MLHHRGFNRIIAGVLSDGSVIPAIELSGIVLFAGIAIRWLVRRLLLACLGVKSNSALASEPMGRVLRRFEKMRTSVWMFAWFKVRLDPMFRELPALLKELPSPQAILDIGCGHGIAGSALLEWCPGSTIVGIDPSGSRVRVASKVFAGRGRAIRGAVPDLPIEHLTGRVDAVLILDVIHFLTGPQLEATFRQVRQRLAEGGWIIIRVSIPEAPSKSLLFRLEPIQRSFTRGRAYYRTGDRIEQMLKDAKFTVRERQMSGIGSELCWFIAVAI